MVVFIKARNSVNFLLSFLGVGEGSVGSECRVTSMTFFNNADFKEAWW